MKRKIIFDKPTTVDVDKLPNGAIFFVDDEPYMKITEATDNFGAKVNSVHLCGGYLQHWVTADQEEDVKMEYFPNHQNIKIVGD